jgi:hypothetical protein
MVTNLAVKVLLQLQDRADVLWGNGNGLFRYDGRRFQRHGPAEGSSPRSGFESRSGAGWNPAGGVPGAVTSPSATPASPVTIPGERTFP